jgi:hypothetical protein
MALDLRLAHGRRPLLFIGDLDPALANSRGYGTALASRTAPFLDHALERGLPDQPLNLARMRHFVTGASGPMELVRDPELGMELKLPLGHSARNCFWFWVRIWNWNRPKILWGRWWVGGPLIIVGP